MATTSRVPASFRVIGRSAVDWWDGWLDMVMVVVVWFLAQLTIVLGPPATFGLYQVVYNMINGEATGVRGLIDGARRYFGKAWLWGLINLVAAVTLFINYSFYGGIAQIWAAYLQMFMVLIAVLWILTQFYTLPFFYEQENKNLFRAIKNGFLTTMAAPFFSLILFVIIVLVVALSTLLVLPLFLGLPGLIPIMGVRAMYNRLEAFGLRNPEKSPKEIEFEEGSRRRIKNLDEESANGDSTPDNQIADKKGQIEEQE